MRLQTLKLLFLGFVVVCQLFATLTAQTMSQMTTIQPFPFNLTLHTNEVKTVHQDSDGYIWLGTTSGVSRWDGYRLKTLRSSWQHPHMLSYNDIQYIDDASDWVWIATLKGISCYHKPTGRIQLPCDTILQTSYINDVEADGCGGMWIATAQRLFYWDGNDSLKTKQINPFEDICPPVDINTLLVDSKGTLWIICSPNVLIMLTVTPKGDYLIERVPSIPAENTFLTFLYEDHAHRYWMGTWGRGLWQFFPDGNGETKYWCQHNLDASSGRGENDYVFGMAESDSLMWLLTYERLQALKYDNGKIHSVEIADAIPTDKMFTSMMSDREGNLWLCSYDEGFIIHFNPSGVRNYKLEQVNQLLHHDANLKGLLSEGKYVWLNQDRFGLLLFDTDSGDLSIESMNKLEEKSVIAKSRVPGSVWTANRVSSVMTRQIHSGMDISTVERFDLSDYTHGYAGHITDIHESANGNLWMLTTQHLFLRPSHRQDSITFAQPTFTAMVGCGDNDVFASTLQGGIVRCIENRDGISVSSLGISLDLFEKEIVERMAFDGGDDLWLATSMGRIVMFSLKTNENTISPLTELIVNEDLQYMAKYANNLYVMTDKKVIVHNVENGTNQIMPTGHNGISVRRFLQRALYIDESGNVFAGGYGGFTKFNNMQDADSVAECYNIVVTDVSIGGESLFFNGQNSSSDNTFRNVTLPCDAKNIEVKLSPLAYGNIEIRLQYKLDDAEWLDTDVSNPAAFFNSLPRGTHRLLVRAQLRNGDWTAPVKVLEIERLPYWYETWWAAVLYVVLFVIGIAAIILKVRSRHARKVRTEVRLAKMGVLSSSHKFTDRVIEIITAHLDDPDFGVEALAKEANMSKSTLHRHLKAEVNITPLELISSIRLKQACKLLMEQNLNISEIAFKLGYSSPKYFSQCFKEQYGVTPSDYRKRGEQPE